MIISQLASNISFPEDNIGRWAFSPDADIFAGIAAKSGLSTKVSSCSADVYNIRAASVHSR